MILRDYECPKCGKQFEELAASQQEYEEILRRREPYEPVRCEDCGVIADIIFKDRSAVVLETIVPTYPKCKRQKAGYSHTSHSDQHATKLQSGYGGCQGPPV